MNIIEINAHPNGAHDNICGDRLTVPEGWAVIPEGVALPATFPFVGVEVADGIVVELTPDQDAYEAARAEREPTEDTSDELTAYEMAAAIREGVNAI